MKGAAGQHVDPLVSIQVGEFVIEERIGAGGMGVVYRASHPLIGKQVAIKVLRPELVSEQQVERLLIEARSVNAIRHPGIIDIFGFGKLPDGRPYITMELLQGATLADLLRQQGRLDVATTVWILDQVLAALGAAHRAGVVHRDLKPGNIFLAGASEGARSVKLVDFGIAKILESHDGPTTVDGAILGTPEFMSPEQIRGKPAGPPADLYAVGIIAFQLLTGARPFNGEPLQILFAHVEQTPPPPSSRVPGIPPELDALVLHLLAKDPAQRPESAEAVRQALKRSSVFQPALSLPIGRGLEDTLTVMSMSESETRTTPSLEVLRTPLPAAAPVAPAPAPAPAAPPAPVSGHWRRAVIGAALLAGLGGGTFLFWPASGTAPAPVPVVAKTKPEEVAPPPPVQKAAAPESQTPPVTAVAGDVPPKVEPEAQQPFSEGEASLKGTASQDAKLALNNQSAPTPTSEVAAVPARASGGVHAAGVVTLPSKQYRAPVLPRNGPQPTDAALARRLSSMEAWYRAHESERDLREFGLELVRLHEAAVKATTFTERSEVQRGLDMWRQRLQQYPPRKPQPAQASPPLRPLVRGSAPPPSSSDKTAQAPVKNLQPGLLREIDEAEQWMRAKFGDIANGSPALADLQRLRQRAQTALTDPERIALQNELSNWKRLRGY